MNSEWMDDPFVQETIARALSEDIGPGDATSRALIGDDVTVEGILLTREACVVSGGAVAMAIFRMLDPSIGGEVLAEDGESVKAGGEILKVRGKARSLLTAERTALNFMQRMCGIATQTKAFVDAIRPLPTIILDTRKTTPGLRHFEKYAVLCGGGANHRFGLYDKVMIKDNHRYFWSGNAGAGDLGAAVKAARNANPGLEIEIEVENEEECLSALSGEPEWILLDNMSPEMMTQCVAKIKGRCRTEASGGITLANVKAVAASGVDAISLGCLTHTARSIDLSLELAR